MNDIIFAYSIDNTNYKGSILQNALNCIPEKFDLILFLIADKIQLYNKAKSHAGLISAIKDYNSKNYFESTKIFLESVYSKVSKKQDSAKFLSMIDFYDGEYLELFRYILVAYEVDSIFKSDVNEQITKYLTDKKFNQLEFELSKLYILEEIALNILIKNRTKTFSEYYIGIFPEVVINIYRNVYSFNYNDFFNQKIDLEYFHFYEYSINDKIWSRR